MSPAADPPALGLRERKRLKTRAAIQRHAFRLFRERGYAATTVEQIAEAAEVSPSTFFRYFPTKEDVVTYDILDPEFMQAFRDQPPELSPLQAMRGAFRQVFVNIPPDVLEEQRQRQELIWATPELRSAMFDDYAHGIDLLAYEIAARLGRQPKEFAIRNLAGAIVGVALAAFFGSAEHALDYSFEAIDAALAHLEAGLPL